MPDARDFQSDFEAAEAAATGGDFATAESLLRRGLARQEAILGGAHPDVASTLNNLAVVCETLGRLDDAERFYRRAHAVASATRPDDDPLVTTSLANLRDFCRAHGRRAEDTAPPTAAFEAPAPPPAAVSPSSPVTRQAPRPARASATVPAPAAASSPAATTPAASVPRGFAAALFLVAAVATGTVSWLWLRPTVPATPAATTGAPSATPSSSTAPSAAVPAPEPAAPGARVTPAAASAMGADTPAAVPAATAEPTPPSAPVPSVAANGAEPTSAPPPAREPTRASATASPESPVAPAASTSGARVMSGELCGTLETRGRAWRCVPLDAPAAPGRVSFVTRVASPVPLRLQHRWSRDGVVRQTVSLSVSASPAEGYRTFSRQSVTPGAWTVALVDASGAVLREVSFEVR